MKPPATPHLQPNAPRQLHDYLPAAVTGLRVRQGKRGEPGGGDSGLALCLPGGPQEQVWLQGARRGATSTQGRELKGTWGGVRAGNAAGAAGVGAGCPARGPA